MLRSRCGAALALSALLVTACGGGDSPAGPGDSPSDPPQPEPHPANVTPTLDPSRTVSARIPVSGGTLQATGADGTGYTLTIPPDALTADTTISMTPLSGLSGLDLAGGHLAGVQFEPEGLSFFREVSFRIDPPEGAHHSALGLVAHGDGTEIHRYPLTPNPDLLELPMLHFTLGAVVVYNGDNPNLGPAADIIPTDPEDRLSSLLGDLWRAERERALQGLAPDPELGQKLQHILQAFYDEVIEPSFNTMKTDCSAAQSLAPRAIRWERRVELVGLHDDFVAQESAVQEAIVAALENCFNTAKGVCLDTSDPVQMNEAAGYSRQLALFGVEDPQYNVLNPELHCSLGWSGTVTSTAQFEKNDGSEVTDVITTDIQWVIDTANTYPGVQTRYQVKRGTITWEQKGTDPFGCTHQGGPQSFDLAPEDGEIVIDEINHTYQATGVTMHFTQANVTCPPGQPSYTSDVSVGTWLITPVTPLPQNATELAGTYEYPGLNTTFVWKFTR